MFTLKISLGKLWLRELLMEIICLVNNSRSIPIVLWNINTQMKILLPLVMPSLFLRSTHTPCLSVSSHLQSCLPSHTQSNWSCTSLCGISDFQKAINIALHIASYFLVVFHHFLQSCPWKDWLTVVSINVSLNEQLWLRISKNESSLEMVRKILKYVSRKTLK